MNTYLDRELTGSIIGAAIEVHRQLGPGLLESVYEDCLCSELQSLGIPFERQKAIPVIYKNKPLNAIYRLDLVVSQRIIVELKSIEEILPIHRAQVLTYMRLSKLRIGIILNFNVVILRQGIKRLIL